MSGGSVVRCFAMLVVAAGLVAGPAAASFPGGAGGFALSGDDLLGFGTYGGEAGIGDFRVVSRVALAPSDWSPDG